MSPLLLAGTALGLLGAAAAKPDALTLGVHGDNGAAARADIMTPRGHPRLVEFDVDEGTDIALDVSPDGRWIIFDLLGHIYRMPVAGGAAECLTQGSGVALNVQPRYSPDGSKIAFISDRGGQLNVWTMNADGSAPRAVLVDPKTRFYDPAWSPDGQSIVAVRGSPTPGRGWHRRNAAIWLLPLAGTPRPLLADTYRQYFAPAFSRDGRTLYFHTSLMAHRGYSIAQTDFRIQQLDIASGRVSELPGRQPPLRSSGETAAPRWQAQFGDVAPTSPAEMEAHPSPDGRQLAFARAAPDRPMRYRGHIYRPSTELVVRDLATGRERVVHPQITKDLANMHAIYAEAHVPSFTWTPDGRAILATANGKIERIDVASGRATVVPFRAHVKRIISEQARGKVAIADDVFPVRYLQSPVTTPDRKRLAFVAVGRVWLRAGDGATPSPLAVPGDGVQFTPSWSPDGTQLAFASWDNVGRGHVWIHHVRDGRLTRVTKAPGEYIHPVWSRDGQSLYFLAGAAKPDGDPRRIPWRGVARWQVLRHELAASRASQIGELAQLAPISVGDDGRIYFAAQADPAAADDLHGPYPSAAALAQNILLSSMSPTTGEVRRHLRFPAVAAPGAAPLPSPDGAWIAYQADHAIFVQKRADADPGAVVETNPNRAIAGRRRIDAMGGADPHWIDATTIEFAAGRSVVRYNIASGAREELPVSLSLPRAVPEGSVGLKGATLITLARGQPAAARGDVLVTGGRIACVGTCDLSKAARVIDVTGKFIMPGLIDVHSHTLAEPTPVIPTYRPESALPLAYGVTTVIDPSVASASLFQIADMVEAGRLVGPRSLGAAEPVIDASLPDGQSATNVGDTIDIDTAAAADYQVGRRAGWGAVTIKNYRQGRREHHQLLADAARRHGVSLTGEGGYASFNLALAMDGQTGWEHAFPSLPIYDDIARFMGAAGVTYSPTAIIAGHLSGSSAYYRPLANLRGDPRHQRFLPPGEIEAQIKRTPEERPKQEFSFPLIAEGLADIVRRGGYGAIGEHGEQPGLGSHWELWAYAEALTPIEALRVATIDGARFVGLDGELGTIEPGKIADLLVLNADPLANIRNSTDIALVMRNGNLFEAGSLKPVWTAAAQQPALGHAYRITIPSNR